MTRVLSISMLAAVLAVGFTGFAQSEERRDRARDHDRDRMREVCTMVTKCHRDEGHRRCEKERVCKMVRR